MLVKYWQGTFMQKEIESERHSSILFLNSIIWPVFILVHLITNKGLELEFGLITPLTLAAISILFTPFTVGLLIHKAIARKIKNVFAQQGA